MEHEEAFEGTEEERQRLENDLLKLKLQAELGAHFGTMNGEALPPEIEKQFLEQIMAFHRHIAEHPPAPLREYLGNPAYKPSSALGEAELEEAWEGLEALLEEKQIRVDFLADYPTALKYDFVTGELLDEAIEFPMQEGQFLCFIYEEFHQNHDYDIRQRTGEFMNGFFEGQFPEETGWYLAGELVTDKGGPMPLAAVQGLLDRFHGLFSLIKEHEYRIEAVSAQPDEEIQGDMPRMGFSEGMLHYTVIRQDGGEQEVTGPFKLYMQCVHGWWEIFFFHMHGFSWAQAAG